jgi:hypothetical protein
MDIATKILEKQNLFQESQDYLTAKKAIVFNTILILLNKNIKSISEKTLQLNNRSF